QNRKYSLTTGSRLVSRPPTHFSLLMPQGKGTALHHATHSGHPEVVSLLLQKGANPKARDNRGDRPGDKFDREVP
ncbi:unnamed protein product, partial [Scytosiphon promiscuus]